MNNSVKKKIFSTVQVVITVCLFLVIPLFYLAAEDSLSDQEIVVRFNRIYFKSKVWQNTKWLGVESWQFPTDAWVMQEIIFEVKPDFIVEAGTFKGGTSLFFASMLELINKNGKVITVDIENQIAEQTAKMDLFKKRVEFILGDSVSPEVISAIQKKVKGRKVFVFLDTIPTKEQVLKELKLYSNFVSVGSYIIADNTNFNILFPGARPGPAEAVEEFLKTDDRFIIDKSRDKFFLGSHPTGYLKRVK